jgi:hypothetical protein
VVSGINRAFTATSRVWENAARTEVSERSKPLHIAVFRRIEYETLTRTHSGTTNPRTTMKQSARRVRPITPLLFGQSFGQSLGGAVVRLAALGVTMAAAAGLSACASSNNASLIHLPDGQTGYAINCSGADAASSWGSCYVLAGNKCGATGYTIVSKDNEEGGPTGGGITNVISANVKNRSMVVRCN